MNRNIIEQIENLNVKLFRLLPSMPLGLFNGKMGYTLYFYILSRYTKNVEYENIARELLDDIYTKISDIEGIDFETGLAGVGMGLRYLIKEKYVSGNINVILRDVDDFIFRKLNDYDYYKKVDCLSLIYIIYYLCLRYKDQINEQKLFLEELITCTFNKLYSKINDMFFEEPPSYDFNYKTPLFLALLGEIFKLNFLNYRILRIMPEISYKIRSIYPVLHANRLYILWGITHLDNAMGSDLHKGYANFLKGNINIKTIFTEELMDKNLFFKNGVSSLYFMINSMENVVFDEKEVNYMENEIFNKIETSDIWGVLKNSDFLYWRYVEPIDNFNIVYILNLITDRKSVL